MAAHFCVNYGDKLYDVYVERSATTGICSLKCSEYFVGFVDDDRRRPRLLEQVKSNFQALTLTSARTSSAAILDCRILTMAENGFRVPCILVGKWSDKESKRLNLMLVSLLPTSSSNYAGNVSMKLSYIGKPLNITNAAQVSAFLLDGPIIHFSKKRFLYVNYYDENARVVALKIPVNGDDATSSSVGDIVAIRATYSTHPVVATIVGRLDFVVSNAPSSSKIITIHFKPKDKDFTVTNSARFPLSSQCHISAAVAGTFVGDQMHLDQPMIRLVTRVSELVEIGPNMQVTNVCKIETDNANSFLCYQRTSSSRKYLFAKSPDDTCCCAVDLDTFQAIRTFKSCRVFVGDFVCRGAPEVLIVEAAAEKALADCKVTVVADLEQGFPSEPNSEQHVEVERIEPSMVAAKQGLTSRSNLGREAVTKVRDQLESISLVINEACGILREIAIGHGRRCDNSARRPHLFELLNGATTTMATTNVGTVERSRCEQCCRPISIGKPWQRIVDRNWIVGVEVTNQSNGSVSDLHLVLTTARRSLVHSTRGFKMKNRFLRPETFGAEFLPRPSKRPRLEVEVDQTVETDCLQPSDTVHLTTSLDIQVLEQESELPINFIITFRWHVNGKLVSGCMNCPMIRLKMCDLLKNRLWLDLMTEKDPSELLCDLAALDVMTETFKVNFVSKQTNLNGIADLFEDIDRLRKVFNVLVWISTDRTVLEGIWIEVVRIQANNQAHVIIHARNRSQFFVCVEYLYSVLPHDVVIIPFPEQAAVRPTVASTVLHEINLIVNFFDDSIFPTIDEDAVTKTKSVKVSVTKTYRKFRNALLRLETKTDNIYGANS